MLVDHQCQDWKPRTQAARQNNHDVLNSFLKFSRGRGLPRVFDGEMDVALVACATIASSPPL